ncbi:MULTISPECIES: sigma-70 family RNA polymerase sigma factor [Sphingobium]|uniref:RNA polymerase sigma factor n=1 Tax=Sphingobium limneticum TaxID=1007511 RepID=A0A5J5HTL2_9SPHN|nr:MULTISPECIES: RNA polymerase sigma factor [Sphingobium]KAA9008554.1 RNA polymerase sigma factor [Sphingobium limneticum]KAA9011384.1 RNA polymerase sigma factor [Sphingobium limneticum]KAA9023676.1 RNA polymerase sigma factor [Sphingobium limneticum]
MTLPQHRAAWLGRHIFPHEAAVRQWLARRPSGWGMDVDDIIQESYAILAGLERIDHIVSPRNYFFEVAKSVVLRSLRRSRVVMIDAPAHAEILEVPEPAPDQERLLSDRQELEQVAAFIDRLPDRCREVFVLRKLRGFSQKDVARDLGIAESTVEKHMVKALASLTNAFGRGGNRRNRSSRDGERDFETERRDAQG